MDDDKKKWLNFFILIFVCSTCVEGRSGGDWQCVSGGDCVKDGMYLCNNIIFCELHFPAHFNVVKEKIQTDCLVSRIKCR